MKKLIPFFTAVLAAVTILSLSGCSARSSVSADEFKKQAEAQGFKVTESTASNTNVEKYLSADKTETGTQIVFIKCISDSAAEETYLTIKKTLTDSKGTAGKTLDSATYNKYTMVNGELSHTLARMNSTIVYGKTTTAHQSEVQKLFDTIKY